MKAIKCEVCKKFQDNRIYRNLEIWSYQTKDDSDGRYEEGLTICDKCLSEIKKKYKFTKTT